MAITIKTPGIHHISLRVSDIERARRFYVDTCGFSLVVEKSDFFGFFVGNTGIGFRPAQESGGFNPLRAGMDHLALACEDEAELERVAAALATAGIENTGVKVDETLGKKYVAFKDPDRIQWEFYMK